MWLLPGVFFFSLLSSLDQWFLSPANFKIPPAFIFKSLKALGRVPFEPLSFIMFCFPPPEQFIVVQICPFCQSLSICRGDYSLCPGARMLRKLKGSVKHNIALTWTVPGSSEVSLTESCWHFITSKALLSFSRSHYGCFTYVKGVPIPGCLDNGRWETHFLCVMKQKSELQGENRHTAL